jgi:transmembrane sensor
MVDDKRIRAEAAAWADRTAEPGVPPEEADAFERWMDASPAHREAFAEMRALWSSDALAEAASAVAQGSRPRRAARIPWFVMAPLGVAMAAACIGAVLFVPWMEHRTLEARRGETRIATLSDGSAIRLNGGARLSVRQGLLRRSATLEQGEAYFDVRHDGRPFVVDTGAGVVRVLGTAFNIDRLNPARAEVTLYRGAVRLRTRDGHTLDLAPGDRATLERGAILRTPHAPSDQPDWIDGWFDTDASTLGRLVAEIDRFSTTPITIDATAGQIPVSGRFRLSRPAAALALISRVYDVEVETAAEQIIVRTRKSPPSRH